MAIHLRISGVVQGVGYRASFEAQARRLHLAGWVRNRVDGSVEAMVDGPTEAIDRIIAWSRRGPSQAHVSGVQVTAAEDAALIPGRFDVLPTA
ncbi:acylphosphatase [Noviherbaspirillum saxi]|uniref:acylphosphatase n=1 Tax=Noviherbaspirillum saxi TaxID=2320863 RepID=A0A3A3GFK5_9BURK|nr:acylphosphatase [Noviherbaspirillum saxi]RJF99689.1 acylphosphatase [Noviherbaspirillum saxi]